MQRANLSFQEAVKLIDHTLLKQTATEKDFLQLTREALDFSFAAICVPLGWIDFCQSKIKSSNVRLATVIGFPLGNQSSAAKYFEIEYALKNGADELDVVFDLGRFLGGDISAVEAELVECKRICGSRTLKVIVESGLLDAQQIRLATKIVLNVGADFIKTSTGFSSMGATPEAVKIMRDIGGKNLKIKASGGIKTIDQFKIYYDLGVDRIGCSQSVVIANTLKAGAT